MAFEDRDFSVVNTPLPHWTRVCPSDPGWLYILRNGDLLKVGKTRNPQRRLFREARTWLPDGEVIGVKPFWNIHELERVLLCGIAQFWYAGEWHSFPDQSWSTSLIDGFRLFDDQDRNKNSVDFSYWISGSGMGESIMEQNHRKVSLRRFQRDGC